jgi:hypothetical protein
MYQLQGRQGLAEWGRKTGCLGDAVHPHSGHRMSLLQNRRAAGRDCWDLFYARGNSQVEDLHVQLRGCGYMQSPRLPDDTTSCVYREEWMSRRYRYTSEGHHDSLLPGGNHHSAFLNILLITISGLDRLQIPTGLFGDGALVC